MLFCDVQKSLFPTDDFHFLSHRKTITPAFTVPTLYHLISCTLTKSHLYIANSLAAAIGNPALYRLLTFQVPSNMSLFRLRMRDTFSRNTPPLRSEWGSSLPPDFFCLQRKHLNLWVILNMCFLRRGVVSTSPNPPNCRTTPRRLSAAAYSIYSQLPSI